MAASASLKGVGVLGVSIKERRIRGVRNMPAGVVSIEGVACEWFPPIGVEVSSKEEEHVAEVLPFRNCEGEKGRVLMGVP